MVWLSCLEQVCLAVTNGLKKGWAQCGDAQLLGIMPFAYYLFPSDNQPEVNTAELNSDHGNSVAGS